MSECAHRVVSAVPHRRVRSSAWRRSSFESLEACLHVANASGHGPDRGLCAFRVWEHPYALLSFGLCMLSPLHTGLEFWKGASAIRAKDAKGLLPS